MKDTPVLVSMWGADNGDKKGERISLTTPGVLTKTDSGYVLKYSESQPDGSDSADIRLTVEGERVTMSRNGDLSAMMVFDKGCPFQGEYKTPYGSLNMNIFASKVHVHLDDEPREINLAYQLSLQGMYTAAHELNISLRERQNGERS
ncbi:MAG: DUF1934 domain-containing protein [Eubacteriales bacterium]|nr:DUF1934 domain-containing protein [Eubacteriales bacterium]MDD3881525.1 DUF1934 domain-containing protein [Eubacteriales bacterium]MDD4512993.1 DUF1934 domain-containing protein [Eubacteriales bacterium]